MKLNKQQKIRILAMIAKELEGNKLTSVNFYNDNGKVKYRKLDVRRQYHYQTDETYPYIYALVCVNKSIRTIEINTNTTDYVFEQIYKQRHSLYKK